MKICNTLFNEGKQWRVVEDIHSLFERHFMLQTHSLDDACILGFEDSVKGFVMCHNTPFSLI